MRRCDRSTESGATAVLTAVLVVAVFLPLAALAVDLGNGWARGRAVQRQADVSAIGAGYLLPMRAEAGHTAAAIAGKVADLLAENAASGQDPTPEDGVLTVTGAQLLDGDPGNGEVEFFKDADLDEPCTDKCPVMRVLPPAAEVRFGFAVAMADGGFDGTQVQRAAVVKVESELPPPSKVIPFWLPSGCGYGTAQPDTSQGNGNPGATTTSTAAASSSGPFAPSNGETGNHQLTGQSPYAAYVGTTQTVSGYTVTNLTGNVDRASLRFVSPNGAFLEYAATPVQKKQSVLNVPPFQVGPEVTDTPGTWQVYALVQSNNQVKYSSNHLEFVVSGAAAPSSSTPSATPSASAIPVGCIGQDRGNFGQLDVPRGDTYNALAANIALGLDHRLAPFVWGSTQPRTKDCGTPQHGFIENAHPDTPALRTQPEPRNCIIGDTGNDGPRIYDGLVTGDQAGGVGRLDAANGSTRAGCGPDVSEGGATLNNDRLSCFLLNGATLAQLAQDTGVTQGMLDPAVVDSPRFVWLPVVEATDRAQKHYQPIKNFVPAFITDETTTSNDAVNPVNGLAINGNSVKVLHVFVFNKDALPEDEKAPSVDYDENVQSPVVRLIG